MTTPPVQGPVQEHAPSDARPALGPAGWRRVRYALALACLVLGVTGLASSSVRSTYGDLKAAVMSGTADEIRVAGSLPAGSSGTAVVSLEWREGGLHRFVDVVQATDPSTVSPTDAGAREVVGEDVGQTLQRLGAAHVVEDAWPESGREILGWRVPGWVGVAGFLLWLGTVALLVNGPQPWWATRWAWFWGLASPAAAVAVPLFLLLSGPPPGVEAPAGPGRRLTGGWAFVLVFVAVPAVVVGLRAG